MHTCFVSLLSLLAAASSLFAQGAKQSAAPIVANIGTITGRGLVRSVAPALDGRRLYYFADDSLFLYDVATRRSTNVAVSPMPLFDMTVSTRGDLIAFARRGNRNTPADVWAMPLNPATGMSAGPSRRVTLTPGSDVPAISPDGKWIAFAADTADGEHLSIVPANGGNERIVLTSNQWFNDLRWSPDGQWIYYRHEYEDRDGGVFHRVAASGGKPQRIIETASEGLGLSPDGTHMAAFRAHGGVWTAAIANADGRVIGELSDDDYKQWLSPSKLLSWTSERQNGIKSYSFADGRVRDLVPTTEDVRELAWAPDGKSFAFASSRDDSVSVLFANADGSGRRTIRLAARHRVDDLSWSPDGRRVAVTAGDTARIHTIEVATGAVQQLRTSGLAEAPHWMSDSRRVRYLTGNALAEGGVRAIREVTLDGRDMLVREIATRVETWGRLRAGTYDYEGTGGWDMWFASDTTVMVRDTSVVNLVSLTSGRSVRLFVGENGRASVSARGDRLAMRPLGKGPNGFNTDAVIVTTTGQTLGKIVFPLGVGQGAMRQFVFTPDGESVIVTGRDAVFVCCDVLIGSLKNGTPRKLTSLVQGKDAPWIALSPDGKTLLFTSAGPYVTRFESYDISAMLRQSANR